MKKRVELAEKEAVKERRGVFICAGLLAVSVVVLHAMVTLARIDTPAFVSLLALAVAIPLLSGCIFILKVELDEKYYLVSKWVDVSSYCFIFGVLGAIVGVIAAIWHVSWIAGVVFLSVALLMTVVVMFYFWDESVETVKPQQGSIQKHSS